MEQLSLSDVITGAWEEIKGHVLKVLKEVVELMLVEGQSKVLGRGRYERGGSRGWRWGYRQLKDSISPGVVSRVLRELDEEHRQWQHRPLGDYPYLVVDGLWVKVKVAGRKQKRVVLFALGMGEDFKGEILAFRIVEGEAEENWTGFLNSLYQRGVKSPLLVIHDGSQAIERGREFVYPHSRSQRCCFHKIANIQLHVEDRRHRREMLRDAAHIYRAHSEQEAYRRVTAFYHRWHASEPQEVANYLQDIEKA